eukprot:592342-Ditylum_brightwellii.AAC.1
MIFMLSAPELVGVTVQICVRGAFIWQEMTPQKSFELRRKMSTPNGASGNTKEHTNGASEHRIQGSKDV